MKTKKLKFENAVFKAGRNITVRRGIKWVNERHALIDGVGTVNISNTVIRACDIKDSDLVDEHDPACRTREGLFKQMSEYYDGFDEEEIVTLIAFNIPKGNMKMDYWKECVSNAADECGLIMTEEQLECIARSVEGGHENYSMAFGYDCIPNTVESMAQEELNKLKKEKEQYENWKNSTRPCKACTTTGIVNDSWGRSLVCFDCDGKGRVRY